MRRRAEARRLEILRAAASRFRLRGFAATGMREIAEAAGLSPANLYHYFGSKQEILFFCQDRSLDRMNESLRGAKRSPDGAAARLRAVLHAHVLCLLDELEGSAAHLEVDALPAPLRRRVVAKRDRYEKGVRDLVAGGVRSGEFAPTDPKLTTLAILGALNWSARWYRSDGPRGASSVADVLSEYLVGGLLPRAASLPARGGRSARTGGVA